MLLTTVTALTRPRRLRALQSISLVAMLAACSGEGYAPETSRAHATKSAEDFVVAAELPSVSQCLTDLGAVLLDRRTARDFIPLGCAAGNYAGVDDRGHRCSLRVDAALKRFSFDYRDGHVEIDWQVVAFRAGGQTVHNLESSALGVNQPGIQVTRFSPIPVPTTEAIVLRAAPQHGKRYGLRMSYLQAKDNQLNQVICRYTGGYVRGLPTPQD